MKAIDYAAPKTLAEAVALLDQHGDHARCLAGGTDLIVQLREYRRDCDVVVDIKSIPELTTLTYDPAKGLTVGAAVPCCTIYERADLAKAYPGLIDAASLIGGMQIQSRASLGGNLCNSSPAADTIPALIAAEGVCVIAGPKGSRELPVEQFCTGPGRNVLGKGELLVALKFPAPKKQSGSSYLRFIPRNEMDIAVVGVGIGLTMNGDRCAAARVAVGAVAPTPLLVPAAGAALVNGPVTDAHIEKAAAAAQAAAKPISDMRGDTAYRQHLVGVLVRRALRGALQRAKRP